MNRPSIYLDYNATTPVKPEVADVMLSVLKSGGNPSSVHHLGRQAKAVLEKSRQTIGDMINCRPQMITFTSGGTEANNIALMSSGTQHLITSASEHDSILQITDSFEGTVEILPLDENGLVPVEDLTTALSKQDDNTHTLISIMMANNETGVLQDIQSLAQIAHEAGATFHTDAIQALGKTPVDFKELGVDMMSLSAHKIGGPQGVGALVALEKLNIAPLIRGGGQEVGRRSGTENLPGIAGFAEAVRLVPKNLQKLAEISQMRDHLEKTILDHAPNAKCFGQNSPRTGNTTTILMPDVLSETQVMAFDLDGICISAGSACSSGKVKASHVISAMGASEEDARCTIRVSLGWNTTQDEVDQFVASWIKLYDRKSNR